jgi:hypothetical protein
MSRAARSGHRRVPSATPRGRQDPQVLGPTGAVEDRGRHHRPLARDPAPTHGLAGDRHGAGVCPDKSDEDPQRRRLAGAIRPEESKDFSRAKLQ